VVTYAGRDPVTGKERHTWHSVKGTKKDAQRESTRLLHQMNTGVYVEPTKITVRGFLEQWLRDSVRPSVTASTYGTYEAVVRCYLTPGLGAIRLSCLQPANIQAAIRDLLEKGKGDGQQGIAPASALRAFAVLHRACEQAVRWGWLGRNPAAPWTGHGSCPGRCARGPRMRRDTSLETATAHSVHYVLYLTAVTTGMRQAEILGLRWSDVNIDAGMASVRQIYYRGAFKEPKTAKGRRTVALPAVLVEALRRHKARQNENRLRWGPEYNDLGLVFAQPNG
jgi:integrase